jgi:hypothetical protein
MRCRLVAISLLAAVTVFLIGFGALLVFYALSSKATDLPGLFAYKSATWGDSLALPTMTGALVFAAMQLPPTRRERLWATAAALGGLLLGAGTQLQWLRDDHPHLNWTLPRPHHFNAAGIYHGLFLTVMCGVIAALWVVLLLRLVNAPSGHKGRRLAVRWLWVALAAGASFVILLVIDSLPARSTSAGTATLVAVGVGVAAVLGLMVSTIARLTVWRRHERRS